MTDLFWKIINMSITASILVLVVLVLRLVLRKAPKWVNVLLWGLVAVRLICPFSIESTFSLIPSTEWIQPESYKEENITPDTIMPNSFAGSSFGENVSITYTPNDADITIKKGISLNYFLPYIWLAGIAVLLIYTVISCLSVYRRVRTAVRLRDNICTSENVMSPFVFGIIRPKIFLPFSMEEQKLVYVVAHEEAHIRRRDHWWKPLGFLLLTVHWFNPLIWIAYILLCRDIELACDEKVVREMGDVERADYSQALLECSVSRRMISVCPLAFGEVGVKKRIKSVLNYKKPAFWIVTAAVIICVIASVCFLTNPSSLRIEKYQWAFSHVQSQNGVIYASADRAYLYNTEDLMDLSVHVENGSLVLKQTDTEKQWDIFYELEESNRYTAIYSIKLGDKTGYAIVAKTKRYDDDMVGAMVIVGAGDKSFSLPVNETTLILSIEDYAIYFYEDTSVSAGNVIIPVETSAETAPTLTLSDALTLSAKGHDLTWEDFARYAHTDVGSGLYIWLFEIDDTFSLKIGGGSTQGSPMYIYLTAKNGEEEERIDIRDGGVEEFIQNHTEESAVPDQPGVPYTIKITRPDLLIFSEPGYDNTDIGTLLELGTYTITEEISDREGIKWGKLKSGLGWIDLDKAAAEAPHIPMTVELANDSKLNDTDYNEYIVTESEHTQKLLFRAYETLTNVRFTVLDYTEGGFKSGNELYSLAEMTADKPLVIGVVFYGDLTTYGISFTDDGGTEHQYMIYLSGRNGSLIMQEY